MLLGGDNLLNANQILAKALESLIDLPVGTKFILSDLFLGWQWNSFDKSERIVAGKLFLIWAEANSDDIEVLERKSRTQYYLKK